jgi:hypothetical protein
MPLILGTNSIKDTGYDVANSLRFNKGDSPSLVRDQSASPTHDDKGTLSFWFKIGKLSSGDGHYFFSVFTDSSNRMQMLLQSDNTLKLLQKTGGSTVINLVTNRVFRDVSAWYHLVIACDSSQGTASNRIKIYINGVQETSFSTETYCNQDVDIQLVKGTAVSLGAYNKASPADFFSGYLAETVLVDGQQLDATSFGEFDEDSGIWKPIDVSGLTFGTNGFYLDFEDSSALGNDASGSNNFTVNNLTATDQSTDTCTNNFATWNNLLGIQIPDSFSEGNLKVARTSGSWTATFSTIAASSGKFYAEVKWVQGSEFTTGFGNAQSYASDHDLNDLVSDPGGGGYLSVIYKNGALYENGSNTGTGYSTYSSGDIIMLAMDLDNYKLYLGVNGTWGNSANPATNSNGVAIPSAYQGDFFHFAVNVHSSGTTTASGNFGSPEFSISSGNADANGYGNFEYAVPSGYYSLNSKNLAEYG